MPAVRILVALAAAAVLPLGLVAPAHAADQYLCSSLEECASEGYGTFGYEDAFETSHWDQDAGHNCTNYVAYRLTTSPRRTAKVPDLGKAKDWNNQVKKWRRWGAKVVSTPKADDIAFWEAGRKGASASGHVAYVQKVEGSHVTISEDNATATGEFQWRVVKASDPSGYLRFSKAGHDATGQVTSVRSTAAHTIEVRGYETDPDLYDAGSSVLVRVYGKSGSTYEVRGNGSYERFGVNAASTSGIPSGRRKVRVYAVNAAGTPGAGKTLLTSRYVTIR